jgi:hypothetical protein
VRDGRLSERLAERGRLHQEALDAALASVLGASASTHRRPRKAFADYAARLRDELAGRPRSDSTEIIRRERDR